MRAVIAGGLLLVPARKAVVKTLALSLLATPYLSWGVDFQDECAILLSYTQEQRIDAALTLVTDAPEARKVAVAILMEMACQEQLPGFSRQEANQDARAFLPYLEQQYGR